jgi:hypothetical protein
MYMQTCPKIHIHWEVLFSSSLDAQLAVVVAAPALDLPPGHNSTRVGIAQSYCNGSDS